MKVIKANKEQLISPQFINTMADHIKAGRVIVYPTDTVYGIGCLATDDKAVDKIYRIKERGKDKPLLVLVDSLDMAKDYFYINSRQEEVLKQHWPGPYSFILKEKGRFSHILAGNKRAVGVRLPKNDFITKMVYRAGTPVVSTSFNISGQKVASRVDKIEEMFMDCLPDIVLDIGRIENRKPSKLMDLTNPDGIKVLRG
jgi:L-threonylcarbamoyladenylate synthase